MERFYFEEPGIKRKDDAIAYIKEFYEFGSDINGAGGLHRYLDDYEGWLQKLNEDYSRVPNEEKVPARTYFLVRESDKRIVGMKMASSKEYLDFILEQLSGLENVTWKAMMGEYIIYWRGKIVGGIYDDRFLVKPTKSAVAMMPDAERELPYEGAKEMLLADVDNREFLEELLEAMYDELPAPKQKKK